MLLYTKINKRFKFLFLGVALDIRKNDEAKKMFDPDI